MEREFTRDWTAEDLEYYKKIVSGINLIIFI